MDDVIFYKCLEHYEAEKKTTTWTELATQFGYGLSGGENLRKRFASEMEKRGMRKPKHSNNTGEDFSYRETVEFKEDGSRVSDKLIFICEEDFKTPEGLLKAHGFDPESWTMMNAKNNLWHMQKKGGTRLLCYQSKITIKPKVDTGIRFEDIDRYFEKKGLQEREYRNVIKMDNNKKVLEIDLADMHIGKRDFYKNGLTPAEKTRKTIDDILSKTKSMNIEKILLVTLGDISHIDNSKGTTTSGTPVETDGMTFAEIMDEGIDILIETATRLSKIAPVELIHIPGNHDFVMSYAIMKSVSYHFQYDKKVNVDDRYIPRKYYEFGDCLVGWGHGNVSNKNKANWLQIEARESWGRTKFAEIHYGHLHHEVATEQNGLVVRFLPSMSGTDSWHYDKGFIGARMSNVSFLWDTTNGLEEIWFSNV